MEGKVYNRFRNTWYELVYEKTMTLLSRDEVVYFYLPPILNNWKLKLLFDSGYSSIPSPIQTTFTKDEIVLTLTNWYSDTGVQNSEPLSLESQDGKLSTLVMIKTTANRQQQHRSLTIAIWKRS